MHSIGVHDGVVFENESWVWQFGGCLPQSDVVGKDRDTIVVGQVAGHGLFLGVDELIASVFRADQKR